MNGKHNFSNVFVVEKHVKKQGGKGLVKMHGHISLKNFLSITIEQKMSISRREKKCSYRVLVNFQ